MAYYSSEFNKIFYSDPIYKGHYVELDCGCCNGLEWGGEEPRECKNCNGQGFYTVDLKTGVIFVLGKLHGRVSKEKLKLLRQ